MLLQRDHIAPTTRDTYETGIRRFTRFCKATHLPRLPSEKNPIIRFIVYLLASGISVSTVKIYLAGIANAHVENGLSSPTRSNAIQRQLVDCKKCTTTGGRGPPKACHLTTHALHERTTKFTQHSKADQLMLWSTFTIAFIGALRVSEYACLSTSTFTMDRTLSSADVSLDGGTLCVKLRKSKADKFAEGDKLCLPSTGKSVCPTRAYTQFPRYRSKMSHIEPLYLFSNGAYLTGDTVDEVT